MNLITVWLDDYELQEVYKNSSSEKDIFIDDVSYLSVNHSLSSDEINWGVNPIDYQDQVLVIKICSIFCSGEGSVVCNVKETQEDLVCFIFID